MWRRIFIILLTLLLSAGCLDSPIRPETIPPTISPIEGADIDHVPIYTFSFGDREEMIRVDVDPAIYAGAKDADKRLCLYSDLSEEEWIPIYYLAFADDPQQESFYTDLIAAFRDIKDREGLDDDRYLEMVTAFVQSIPYGTDDSNTEPKFPVETYVDEEGDCDDKSLLLAGLLAREGYQVALLYFGEEKHMAVGVGSAGCHYRDTSYAYIETTNASYIGIPPLMLSNGVSLTSDPLVIPVGDGTRLYGAHDQITLINDVLSLSQARFELLTEEISEYAEGLSSEAEDIEFLGARIADLYRPEEIEEGERLTSIYNQKVQEYNDLVRSYNALLEESRTVMDLHNHLATHSHDRPGSFLRAMAYWNEQPLWRSNENRSTLSSLNSSRTS